MLDPRRKRLISLFLANAASGVVAVVLIFFGVALTEQAGPLAPVIALVGVPAAGISMWRAHLQQQGHERDLAKRVAWQALRILIAWEVVALGIMGFFLFFAFSAMAPVPHSHDTAGMLALIVIFAAFVLALRFTWVRSRQMLDLLSPLPGVPQPGSEPPYWQLKV